MKNIIKYILYGLNAVALFVIYLWYKNESGFEPIVVLITQIVSVLTIVFEKQISGTSSSISKIDNSKVKVEEIDDDRNVEIKNVSNKSKVTYKRTK